LPCALAEVNDGSSRLFGPSSSPNWIVPPIEPVHDCWTTPLTVTCPLTPLTLTAWLATGARQIARLAAPNQSLLLNTRIGLIPLRAYAGVMVMLMPPPVPPGVP